MACLSLKQEIMALGLDSYPIKCFHLLGSILFKSSSVPSAGASWANMSGYATHKLYFSHRSNPGYLASARAQMLRYYLITQLRWIRPARPIVKRAEPFFHPSHLASSRAQILGYYRCIRPAVKRSDWPTIKV